VSISRDLREIARTLEELTADSDFRSDSIKRLWMSMALLGNVQSLENCVGQQVIPMEFPWMWVDAV
jgi:hypothetical protein